MSSIPFDPSKFTAPKAKPLPVLLLLDVSGSMSGEKIHNLNEAVRDMLAEFSDTATSETEIWVSIITFGSQVELHQALARADDIRWQNLSAGGSTPLGAALQMAKAMIENKDVVPSRAYRPTVVLISDGQPDKGWEAPLHDFINAGRSAKCDRMAMAIGLDADKVVLSQFIAGTPNPLFYAENARQLKDFFKLLTMSVGIRTQSPSPNTIPQASSIQVQPVTIEARKEKSISVVQSTPDDGGGYW